MRRFLSQPVIRNASNDNMPMSGFRSRVTVVLADTDTELKDYNAFPFRRARSENPLKYRILKAHMGRSPT
jgi:hypothetical protein